MVCRDKEFTVNVNECLSFDLGIYEMNVYFITQIYVVFCSIKNIQTSSNRKKNIQKIVFQRRLQKIPSDVLEGKMFFPTKVLVEN